MPWLTDVIANACDPEQIRMLPLKGGAGTAALLLHDRPSTPSLPELLPVTSCWGAAIIAAMQHEGAQRMGEQLAETNRALADAHEQLLRQESMARLGEMAAGAAHEMNNPLAVICGRGQLLSMTLQPGSDEHQAARNVVEQANRLSDLITALSTYADAPIPHREPTDLAVMLDDAVRRAKHMAQSTGDDRRQVKPINLQIHGELPMGEVDPKQLATILRELLANAVQALPKTSVTVSARHEPVENLLIVHVADDGVGMNDHAKQHAFDPFFSAKPAGRRVGMGLPLARQLATRHGGHIELRSVEDDGTVATLSLPLSAAS